MPFIQLAREDWERAATELKTLLQRNEPFPSPKMLSTLAELLVITGKSAEEQREIEAGQAELTRAAQDRRHHQRADEAGGNRAAEHHDAFRIGRCAADGASASAASISAR